MTMSLIEWTKQYFKHKNIIEKNLKNIKEEKKSLVLNYKKEKKLALIKPVLDDNFDDLKDYKKKYLITSLSETNIDFLIDNWKKFLIKNLIMIFVDIRTDNNVLLNPYIHDRIMDKKNKEKAIRTLFEQ